MTNPMQRELDVTTPDDTSIVVRRDFDAPPDRVWRAHTEPEHLRRWLGRADFPLTTCEMDVRVGGAYHWVFTSLEGGQTMGVRGTYEEVAQPSLLTTREQFDDFPGPSVNTMRLSPAADARTSMTLTIRYVDKAMRDGWLESGMTVGMTEGYARLDEALTTVA